MKVASCGIYKLYRKEVSMKKKDFYKFVLDGIKDGVYFVDQERKITFWNQASERITGFSKDEVIGKYCFDNILNHVDGSGCDLCHNGCPLHETLKDGEERENTVYFHHKDGHRVETTVYIMPIVENGEIIGAVETFSEHLDAEYLQKNIEKLRALAYYDQLTTLPNRRYIDDQLKAKHEVFKLTKMNYGVAVIDLDHFKVFNDTHGHSVGDLILKMVSRIFQSATRGEDFIGRWGGEEFLLVVNQAKEEEFVQILERIRMLVEKSTLRETSEDLYVTVSIGGAIIQEAESLESLFKRADKALYSSKNDGRNKVSIL